MHLQVELMLICVIISNHVINSELGNIVTSTLKVYNKTFYLNKFLAVLTKKLYSRVNRR